MAKYELDMDKDAIEQFILEAESMAACKESIEWGWRRQTHDFESFVVAMVNDPLFSPSWLAWCIVHFKEKVSKEIRDSWLQALKKKRDVVQHSMDAHPELYSDEEKQLVEEL